MGWAILQVWHPANLPGEAIGSASRARRGMEEGTGRSRYVQANGSEVVGECERPPRSKVR